MKFSKIFAVCAATVVYFGASAQNMAVRWGNEANDTTIITEWLKKGAEMNFSRPSERTAWLGRQLVGIPYVGHTLEGDTEVLSVYTDKLDCTTLAETVMALSYTLGERREGWQDFIYNLRRIRYRGGEVDGYGSRLHYICDWAMDNIHRGNFVDATRDFYKCKYIIRSIDYMSAHRDRYAALKDSAEFARIKQVENGYRNHRFPYIKSNDLYDKTTLGQLREGDILAFVSNLPDLDVTHMGMVVKGTDGKLYVLHASDTAGKVVVSDVPIADFMKRNRQWIGVRVFRLTN